MVLFRTFSFGLGAIMGATFGSFFQAYYTLYHSFLFSALIAFIALIGSCFLPDDIETSELAMTVGKYTS